LNLDLHNIIDKTHWRNIVSELHFVWQTATQAWKAVASDGQRPIQA
jgi:hypothetical protein